MFLEKLLTSSPSLRKFTLLFTELLHTSDATPILPLLPPIIGIQYQEIYLQSTLLISTVTTIHVVGFLHLK